MKESTAFLLDVMSIVVLIAAMALGYLLHRSERRLSETPKQR